MKRVSIIGLLYLFWFVHSASGQWTEKDSLWLQQVLSGEEDLKLSPEVEKAILGGTLLNTGQPNTPLLAAPPILPISKDFSDMILPDTIRDVLDLLDLPPAVFMKYMTKYDSIAKINPGAYTPTRAELQQPGIKIPGIPTYVETGAGNLFLPEVRDGQKRGSINLTLRTTFSAEDILRTLFWKSERDKKRNRKKATAWKYYNISE